MDTSTNQTTLPKPSLLNRIRSIFRWRRHETEEEKEKKQVLKTFSNMRKESMKERNQAVFNQRNDNHHLLVLLSDMNRYQARLTPHEVDDDNEEWERRINEICELEQSIKRRKITVRRLNNTIINCSRHMEMVENM